MKDRIKDFHFILNALINRYRQRVPDVSHIVQAMMQQGLIENEEDIENDHIAFRTLGVPNLGINSLEKVFLYYGYRKMDHYDFSEKKLDAWWYAPPAEGLPRIFISELRVSDLSPRAEAIITSYTRSIKKDPVDDLDLDDPASVDLFLHHSLWRLPTLADYEELAAESEYAAWVICNRYYLNHFTIAVHNLPNGFNSIERFNQFLQQIGIQLNDSGGLIKTSPDGGLLQSSTVAPLVKGLFAFGKEKMIPGSYVEFAERRILPQFADLSSQHILPHHRREGFEAANADKIFESTYFHQVVKV
jgi:hypothetical protein